MQTHYKKLMNPDYIGSYSFDPGIDKTVTILSVAKEMVTGPEGKKEECIVAKLKGEKPLILNSTNCKTITKLFSSPYIEDWANKQVTLYVAQVKAFGDVVDAVRIRPTKPELPKLTPTHPKWESAKTSLKSGQVTIEQIKKNYQITNEHEKLISQ